MLSRDNLCRDHDAGCRGLSDQLRSIFIPDKLLRLVFDTVALRGCGNQCSNNLGDAPSQTINHCHLKTPNRFEKSSVQTCGGERPSSGSHCDSLTSNPKSLTRRAITTQCDASFPLAASSGLMLQSSRCRLISFSLPARSASTGSRSR